MCNKYNGYSNYVSWNVALWIDNDEYSQSYWQGVAEEAESIHDLAERLKDEIANGELTPLQDDASMYTDLLGWALQSVDWYELAEGYWAEYHREEAEAEAEEE